MTAAPILYAIGVVLIMIVVASGFDSSKVHKQRRTHAAIVGSILLCLVLARLLLPNTSCVAVEYPRVAAMGR